MTTSEKKTQVQALFGAHAQAYTTSAVHARGASLGRLVACAAPQSDDLVLDVATGTGHNALAFAPHARHVTGVDLTAAMLTEACLLAQQREITNVAFCRGDSERLPFASGRFAIVTCRVAAHHFPDVAAAIREMARVCRPGGGVAIVDNVTPEDRAACAALNAWETLRDPSHHWAYPLSQWRQFMHEAGLTLEVEETLAKPMAFFPWARRLGVGDAVVQELHRCLFEEATFPRTYLRPRVEHDEAYFDLTEGLFVARKGP